MRILIGITGASGSLYAHRLVQLLLPHGHEIHVVMSRYARAVIAEEMPDGLEFSNQVTIHNPNTMQVACASGSNAFDVMAVIPCSMGTLARIAHGLSTDLMLRTADVMLKERKKLILVPRETPLNLIHIRNFELLLLAGAILIPANPSFYSHPTSVADLADTVVARVLDHMGIDHGLGIRWLEEKD